VRINKTKYGYEAVYDISHKRKIFKQDNALASHTILQGKDLSNPFQ